MNWKVWKDKEVQEKVTRKPREWDFTLETGQTPKEVIALAEAYDKWDKERNLVNKVKFWDLAYTLLPAIKGFDLEVDLFRCGIKFTEMIDDSEEE